MRYHFFLHHGLFFQNLGKEAVQTFMHTTVSDIPLMNGLFVFIEMKHRYDVQPKDPPVQINSSTP